MAKKSRIDKRRAEEKYETVGYSLGSRFAHVNARAELRNQCVL